MHPQTLEIPAGDGDLRPQASRLNAAAPAFVPRAPPPHHHHHHHFPQFRPPPPPTIVHVFHPPIVRPFFDPVASEPAAEIEPDSGPRDSVEDEVARKIRNQVEYYFSDLNLATTGLLMKFISRDPDGFVPMTVIASFKKIKMLVHDISLLVSALRTSKKLVVSDNGKKVRREKPFTEADLEELQSRIVVAENLPEDHCYQNLMKIFSSYGRSVKTIRTCYPQPQNIDNRLSKIDMLFANKLHAFAEYDTFEDAEKVVAELNNENNERNRLRVQLLLKCLPKDGPPQGRRVHPEGGNESDVFGEDNFPAANQLNKKERDNQPHLTESLFSHEDAENLSYREVGARHGKGRGRGTRGRNRGRVQVQHHHNDYYSSTPPSNQTIHAEQQQAVLAKQPPGPGMPDGTRGFTMGRGKSLSLMNTTS